MKKKISICIPVRNEEKNLRKFYHTLIKTIAPNEFKYDFEIIFTDNCSADNTENIIEEICREDKRVKYIRFAKNYGYEKSLELNYLSSTGDALISIDCDFQDPPEILLQFIKKWEDGYELVIGKRNPKNEFFVSLFLKKIFYSLILKKNSEMSLSGDFRLISNKIKKYINKNSYDDLFLRSFINELNLKKTYIIYDRVNRLAGESKTNFFTNFKIVLKALTYEKNSIFQFISFINMSAFFFAVMLASYYFIIKIFDITNMPYGVASIHILVLTSIGINGISFSIIFLYLKKITMKEMLSEVQISKTINLEN
jgi:dolichol-phosphate mannosyltransferase